MRYARTLVSSLAFLALVTAGLVFDPTAAHANASVGVQVSIDKSTIRFAEEFLTGTVTLSDPTLSGTINVVEVGNNYTWAHDSIVNGTASIPAGYISVGTHSLYISFYDSNGNAGQSAPFNLVVEKGVGGPSLTNFVPATTSSPAQITVGLYIPLNTSGSRVVHMSIDGSFWTDIPLDSYYNSRTEILYNIPTGTHTLSATYDGDENLLAHTTTLTESSGKLPGLSWYPNITNNPCTGQPIANCVPHATQWQPTTAYAWPGAAELGPMPTAKPLPTGSVRFYDGPLYLGSGLLSGAQASLTFAPTTSGRHDITTYYDGDSTYSPSPGFGTYTIWVDEAAPPANSVALSGYRIFNTAGESFSPRSTTYGTSFNGHNPSSPIVGGTATPSGDGYWLVSADGGVYRFGNAAFYGSMGGRPLNKPIVGMAATASGQGYWLVASDGGIFSFGDAPFYGSMGGKPLNKPIVGMTASATGHGYRFVASDGGIFSFGDAQFYGSMGGQPLNKPVVGMAPTQDGLGYWLVASDGGIFSFGNAPFYGSTGSIHLNKPIVGMKATGTSHGYWFVASDGGLFAYGDAQFAGSALPLASSGPIIGIL